jgi:hypothetical protein
VAERRGRDVEARGGTPKMQLLGNRGEIPQVAQFHGNIMRYKLIKCDNAVNDIPARPEDSQCRVVALVVSLRE